jgi:hypothetical protein
MEELFRIRPMGLSWFEISILVTLGLALLSASTLRLVAMFKKLSNAWATIPATFAALGILGLCVAWNVYEVRPDFVTKHGMAVWTNGFTVDKAELESFVDDFLVELDEAGFSFSAATLPTRLVFQPIPFDMVEGGRVIPGLLGLYRLRTIWVGHADPLRCSWLGHEIAHGLFPNDPGHKHPAWKYIEGEHRKGCKEIVNYSTEEMVDSDLNVASTPEGVRR